MPTDPLWIRGHARDDAIRGYDARPLTNCLSTYGRIPPFL